MSKIELSKNNKTEITSSKRLPVLQKRRHDNYIGKYKINIEESSFLKDFVSRNAFYIKFNTNTKNYEIYDKNREILTLMSENIFINIPKDKEYEISQILDIR